VSILGAHQSISGGHHKAVEIAKQCGCDCVQLFTGNPRQFPRAETTGQYGRSLTKNNNQWRAKELTDDDAVRFQAALREAKVLHPLSHDSYLINLAAPDETLWRRSLEAFIIELQRAERLGIPYVVTHPGSYTSSSEEAGLKRIIEALDETHRQTRNLQVRTLLENTAGQGTNLGWRFEHLAEIIGGVKDPGRLGVCIDTCHVFAAGYPLATQKQYKATFCDLDKIVGLKLIKAFHLNDSKRELGSRVDRHEHIGRGQLGLEPFRFLLNDSRFKKVPMYLETPKEANGENRGLELDAMNLATLRGLVEK
jgi:deoxyribonuclease IV